MPTLSVPEKPLWLQVSGGLSPWCSVRKDFAVCLRGGPDVFSRQVTNLWMSPGFPTVERGEEVLSHRAVTWLSAITHVKHLPEGLVKQWYLMGNSIDDHYCQDAFRLSSEPPPRSLL